MKMKEITGALSALVCLPVCLLVVFCCFYLSSCTAEESAGPLLPSDYDGWVRTTNEVLDYPIPGHEDHYRVIYINPIGENPRQETVDGRLHYTYPEGTIVLKEIYTGEGRPPQDGPEMLMGMIKQPEHPEALEGWLWLVTETAGNEETLFTTRFCVSCHANANEPHHYGDKNLQAEFRDYLFFPYD